MELSPCWEAASCTAAQEFPNILWRTNIHYRVYRSPIRVFIEIINSEQPCTDSYVYFGTHSIQNETALLLHDGS
jgi:hypothetical protein